MAASCPALRLVGAAGTGSSKSWRNIRLQSKSAFSLYRPFTGLALKDSNGSTWRVRQTIGEWPLFAHSSRLELTLTGHCEWCCVCRNRADGALRRSPSEGPESAPRPSFHREREIAPEPANEIQGLSSQRLGPPAESVEGLQQALLKVDPAEHRRLAAAANESPGDYAVSLFRYCPHQARSSQIDALSNGGFQSQRHFAS